jgi:ribonuclease BN (tRNA processing enzyme)
VQLTVLGASSRYLAPLGAGTSYLASHGATRLVLDCGNDTAPRLREELGDAKPSGVLVSHFHLDTVSDLFPVAFALPPGAPLLAPRGAMPRLGDLLRAYSMDRSWFRHARLLGVGRGDEHVVGEMRLTFTKAGHGCPGVATRLEAGGRSLVYLGDTGPRPWLADFARGADLVVAHTLLLDRDGSPAQETNLTAGAAGRLARDAGAARLALSHVPFYGNVDASLDEAQREFGGKVLALREGERVAI